MMEQADDVSTAPIAEVNFGVPLYKNRSPPGCDESSIGSIDDDTEWQPSWSHPRASRHDDGRDEETCIRSLSTMDTQTFRRIRDNHRREARRRGPITAARSPTRAAAERPVKNSVTWSLLLVSGMVALFKTRFDELRIENDRLKSLRRSEEALDRDNYVDKRRRVLMGNEEYGVADMAKRLAAGDAPSEKYFLRAVEKTIEPFQQKARGIMARRLAGGDVPSERYFFQALERTEAHRGQAARDFMPPPLKRGEEKTTRDDGEKQRASAGQRPEAGSLHHSPNATATTANNNDDSGTSSSIEANGGRKVALPKNDEEYRRMLAVPQPSNPQGREEESQQQPRPRLAKLDPIVIGATAEQHARQKSLVHNKLLAKGESSNGIGGAVNVKTVANKADAAGRRTDGPSGSAMVGTSPIPRTPSHSIREGGRASPARDA